MSSNMPCLYSDINRERGFLRLKAYEGRGNVPAALYLWKTPLLLIFVRG